MSNKHTRTDPYKLPQFWVDEMTARLASQHLSPAYRKRCERLMASERKKLQKPTSTHYPHDRV